MKTTEVRSGMTLHHTKRQATVQVVDVRRGAPKSNSRTVRVEFPDGRQKWVLPSALVEAK